MGVGGLYVRLSQSQLSELKPIGLWAGLRLNKTLKRETGGRRGTNRQTQTDRQTEAEITQK